MRFFVKSLAVRVAFAFTFLVHFTKGQFEINIESEEETIPNLEHEKTPDRELWFETSRGNSITLTCPELPGSPPAIIEVHEPMKMYPGLERKLVISTSGEIRLHNVTDDDAKTYFCSYFSEAPSQPTAKIHLDVIDVFSYLHLRRSRRSADVAERKIEQLLQKGGSHGSHAHSRSHSHTHESHAKTHTDTHSETHAKTDTKSHAHDQEETAENVDSKTHAKTHADADTKSHVDDHEKADQSAATGGKTKLKDKDTGTAAAAPHVTHGNKTEQNPEAAAKSDEEKDANENYDDDARGYNSQANPPFQAPSPPEVLQLSDTSVELKWTSGSLRDKGVKAYKVEYLKGNDNKVFGGDHAWHIVAKRIKPKFRIYKVNDLEPEMSYRFRIATIYARNRYVYGAASGWTKMMRWS